MTPAGAADAGTAPSRGVERLDMGVAQLLPPHRHRTQLRLLSERRRRITEYTLHKISRPTMTDHHTPKDAGPPPFPAVDFGSKSTEVTVTV
jgi:hypothetical protein